MARHRKSTNSNSNETSVASRVPERTLRRSARLKYTEAQTEKPARPAKPAKPAQSAKSAKRRPKEILNTSRLLRIAAKKAQKAGLQSVAPSCPLLELPAEIRNYIWELVLGGEALHVWGSPPLENDNSILDILERRRWSASGVWHCCKCFSARHPEQQAEDFKATTDRDGGFEFLEVHDTCREPSLLQYHKVALLRTCRQIHSEAALLPFVLNTFLFDNHIQLFHFLRFVTPKQAKAIQNICVTLSGVDSYDEGDPEIFLANQKLYKERLGGLESLTIFAVFYSGYTNKTLGKAAMAFKLLDLKKVIVAAFYETLASDGDLLKNGLNYWAGDVEGELMKDWAKEEKRKKTSARTGGNE